MLVFAIHSPLSESFAVYSIDPNTLRSQKEYSASKPMQPHGENWVSILKDQKAKTWRPDLIAALTKLTGNIDDVRAKRVGEHLVAQVHRTVQRRQRYCDRPPISAFS